jgi:hypothetical protein
MTAEEMSEKILGLICAHGDASFAEIMSGLADEAKGNLEWSIAPNVVLWTGMSAVLMDAFRLLRDRIKPHPTHFLTYYSKSVMLSFPVLWNA